MNEAACRLLFLPGSPRDCRWREDDVPARGRSEQEQYQRCDFAFDDRVSMRLVREQHQDCLCENDAIRKRRCARFPRVAARLLYRFAQSVGTEASFLSDVFEKPPKVLSERTVQSARAQGCF